MDKVRQRRILSGGQRLLQHRHLQIRQQLATRSQPLGLPGLIGVDNQRRLRHRRADRHQPLGDKGVVQLDFQQPRAVLPERPGATRHRFGGINADGLRRHYLCGRRNAVQRPEILALLAALQIP